MKRPTDKKKEAGGDDALWQRVAETTEPLKNRPEPPKQPQKKEPEAQPRTNGPKKKPTGPTAKKPAPTPPPVKTPALEAGNTAGLDKRNAQRLVKGRMAIEARLDLHGLYQEAAHTRLDRFLAQSYSEGKRCVLVITGKGQRSGGVGILQSQVPRWLNEPANRQKIVSFSRAQPKDGGAGALYILLKRQR